MRSGQRATVRHLLAVGLVIGLAWQALTGCVQAASVYTLSGKIVHVADGDTVTLLTNDGQRRRLRLASIDAPELSHGSQQPGQPYGAASGQNLASMVAGRQLMARCYERDQYGRDVCDLPASDGRTASWHQVADGYAWANTVGHGQYLRDHALPMLEAQAREAQRGLWHDARPVQPWKWRYACWREHQCDRSDA